MQTCLSLNDLFYQSRKSLCCLAKLLDYFSHKTATKCSHICERVPHTSPDQLYDQEEGQVKATSRHLPDDAVLCLLLVLQLVVDDSSHCQGPGIATQERDGSPGHAPQALLHVLMGHLKVGWVSIHIVQVQIQQSDACRRNIKAASTRNVCSVPSVNLKVWPGPHLGHTALQTGT